MAQGKKQEMITFKVNEKLAAEMRGVHNRSEFIRNAIMAALDNICPVCSGTGILTPDQKQHWENFSQNHSLKECGNCHAVHLMCDAGGREGHQW